MKKLLALLLALAMMLTMLVGCGGGEEGGIEGEWIMVDEGEESLKIKNGKITVYEGGEEAGTFDYELDGEKVTVFYKGSILAYGEFNGETLIIGESEYERNGGKSEPKEKGVEGEWQHMEDDDETLVIKNGKVKVYEDGEVIFSCSYEQNGNEIILRHQGEEIYAELDGDILDIQGDEYERID